MVSDDKVLEVSESMDFAKKNKRMGTLSINRRRLWL
jgi:hypothetical protein